MRKIARLLLIGVGLFIAVFASANSFSVEAVPSPCGYLRSIERCEKYPSKECTWNSEYSKCELNNDPQDRCKDIKNYFRCMKSPFNCVWDDDKHRCKRRQ